MSQKTFEYKNISVCLESPDIPLEDVEKIIDFLIRERYYIYPEDKYRWHDIKTKPGKEKTIFKKILLRLDNKGFDINIENQAATIKYLGAKDIKEKGIEILLALPLFAQSSEEEEIVLTFQLK